MPCSRAQRCCRLDFCCTTPKQASSYVFRSFFCVIRGTPRPSPCNTSEVEKSYVVTSNRPHGSRKSHLSPHGELVNVISYKITRITLIKYNKTRRYFQLMKRTNFANKLKSVSLLPNVSKERGKTLATDFIGALVVLVLCAETRESSHRL